MKTIVQKEAVVLREISKEVPLDKIKTVKTQNILKEMRMALDSQDDGVAIAASQIGYPLRIFVVSYKVADMIKKNKNEKTENDKTPKENGLKKFVFINPVIKKLSKEKKIVEEGCLSVRYLYGKVKRSNKVLIEAYDEFGNKFIMGGAGLLAQIFQHEVDHLNGVLFTDKAKYIEEMIPPHLNKKN